MEERFRLGHFAELVLIAIANLGENAYGVRIRQHVEAATGRTVAIGAIYTTLERLEEKEYVSSWEGQPTAQRGGRAKRFYKVEGAGHEALRRAEQERRAVGLAPAFGINAIGGLV